VFSNASNSGITHHPQNNRQRVRRAGPPLHLKTFSEGLLLGPDGDGFALRGQASIEKLVHGLPCANSVASPAGFATCGPAEFELTLGGALPLVA
jgi:hypothetical protein